LSNAGQRGIGVLVADSPYGPFKDPIGKPLVKNSGDDIDPTVLIDDDGQAYLYWGNPNLWYVKLNEDMISVNGDVVKDPSIAKVKGSPDPFHYQEGPWVWKKTDIIIWLMHLLAVRKESVMQWANLQPDLGNLKE
jgi:beta-xylosidase